MSDFGHFGGSEEEYATVQKLFADVDADPDNFEHWEALIKACETLEGGLNRNSSPHALSTFRIGFDRFLNKFPLLFGYWKKYADMEFNIAGPEAAEMVYERGCANIVYSVDLWTEYCSFKMETTHVPHLVRDLFERGAAFVGLDFLAHPFWDKYIEYEERQEAQDRVFAIHSRVLKIPMHQYARYYEKFRNMALHRPLNEIVSADVLTRFRSEVQAEAAAYGGPPRTEAETERDVRSKIDGMYYDTFNNTQSEVTKRWTYESENKRPYFHVTELEHSQLNNWRKYLDFEEAEGDFDRVVCLYERCLTTCALYDEFWFRYARWMSAQPGKEEDVRSIYARASTMFVPVSRPGIRLQWALFEESRGRVDVAIDIHKAILIRLPDCVEVIVSWAHTQRRQIGLDAAVQVLKDHIDAPTVDIFTKGALVAEWAAFLWRVKGSVEEARSIFLKNVQWYADSRLFWDKWFQFELEQPLSLEKQAQHAERVKTVFTQFQNRTRLSTPVKQEIGQLYLGYLMEHGGKNAMQEFLQVDRDMFGPSSIAMLAKTSDDAKENGASMGELDEASRFKAEARFLNFYELHGSESQNADAQGSAGFN